MNTSKLLLLFFIILTYYLAAQSSSRETRAVWLTTNFALDWPPKSYDESIQKSALREIFQDLNKKKFNTVYFQVRSNGTLMYPSEIEPFSPYLKGKVGLPPNYDPLQYAIELGKEYNIEVHAWVNMVRCFSGSDDSYLQHPKHVRNTHPELTVMVMDENGRLSYWMNPGYYKTQDYLVNILLEITNKYDVDGIQLDFFRYPGREFGDEEHFSKYGLNTSLEDWRRNNLTSILRKLQERINPKNPKLKIGATPIGIRNNLDGAKGWEGFSSAFQDTETWLKEGLVDYLAPQIYWDFNNNPRFDVLAKDWTFKSYNRNIVLGLAAYKSDVKNELARMIDFSREIGAAGVAFFRYSFISSETEQYFDDIMFPADMNWKDDKNITKSLLDSEVSYQSEDEVMITWKDSEENFSNKYRSYILLLEERPTKYFPLNKNKLKLKFGKPSKLVYSYQISKLDRLWNYSTSTDILEIPVPYLYNLKKSSMISSKPMLHKKNKTSFLSVFSNVRQSAAIDIINIENIGKQEIKEFSEGINIFPINENVSQLSKIRITFHTTGQVEELTFFN
jgi:uncharacterized lipoprotein YddW (UPF0748 family)